MKRKQQINATSGALKKAKPKQLAIASIGAGPRVASEIDFEKYKSEMKVSFVLL